MPAHPPPVRSPARRSGFTLIELMIAVAVVGILAALALPSFIDSIRKGRRSEAVAALAQVQQSQERWRANRPTYTATLSDLQLNLDAEHKTPSGYYVVNLENDASASRYTATATAVTGTTQAQDSQCTVLRVRLQGGNLQYGGCAGCEVPDGPLTDPNRCWSR
jgi:type IV pilus assembly protein PilE